MVKLPINDHVQELFVCLPGRVSHNSVIDLDDFFKLGSHRIHGAGILMLTFIGGISWWDPWHTINIAAPWIRHGYSHGSNDLSRNINGNFRILKWRYCTIYVGNVITPKKTPISIASGTACHCMEGAKTCHQLGRWVEELVRPSANCYEPRRKSRLPVRELSVHLWEIRRIPGKWEKKPYGDPWEVF